jgi:hypothetical protein
MTPAELSSVIVAAVRGAIADGELALADSAVPAPGSVPLRSAHDSRLLDVRTDDVRADDSRADDSRLHGVPADDVRARDVLAHDPPASDGGFHDGGGSDGRAREGIGVADYATALPLRLAAATGRPAGEVATVLAKHLGRAAGVRAVRVAGPSLLAVSLRAPGALAAAIVATGERYASAAVPRPSCAVWPTRPMTFDNPGFLVRFAHVRAVATARHSGELGIARGPLEPELLDTARERALLGRLGELPRWAELAARRRDPYVFARHLVRVADAYHEVYEHCPALPRGDHPATARQHARLWLAAAVQVALSGGLRALGETPPERL